MDGACDCQSEQNSFSETYRKSVLERTCHQLIVIGNGFDLACGLESSFKDFFEPRMHNLASCWQSNEGFEFGKMFELGLTAWDIVLSSVFPGFTEEENTDWSDVELAIEHTVRLDKNNKEDGFSISVRSICDVIHSEKAPEKRESERKRRWSSSLSFDNSDMFQHIRAFKASQETKAIASYLLCKYSGIVDWSIKDVSHRMLEELHELENAFDNYLTQVLSEKLSYIDDSAGLLQKLFADDNRCVVDTEKAKNTVFCFNYTTPGEPIIGRDGSYEIINVHGRLGEGIIIGIDGTECMDNPDVLEYTKTYRLMTSASSQQNTTIAFPPSNYFDNTETVAIKIYGHSLAHADYAYFQSLFDITDLYNGYVTLIFYYQNNRTGAEERAYKKAINLLVTYGRTLDNKDHGNNLIHKLLLENRLIVKPLT